MRVFARRWDKDQHEFAAREESCGRWVATHFQRVGRSRNSSNGTAAAQPAAYLLHVVVTASAPSLTLFHIQCPLRRTSSFHPRTHRCSLTISNRSEKNAAMPATARLVISIDPKDKKHLRATAETTLVTNQQCRLAKMNCVGNLSRTCRSQMLCSRNKAMGCKALLPSHQEPAGRTTAARPCEAGKHRPLPRH